ncbi:MAG TPA: hypothetical protein VK633_14280, partial [Verrucomicrobiae bacterium]|nr:hypothetical protein [Verrucomicrobiae bacterium]
MRLSVICSFVVVFPLLCPAQGVGLTPPIAPATPQASLMPPHPRSVTDFFRQLLVALPAEQAVMLASKPLSIRVVLQQKLEEYRALPPAECELRLHALDLRGYLTALMRLPATNRTTRLAAIPEKDR